MSPTLPHVRTRLTDLATQAGVSTATVSRVLNGKPGVSPEARQAVLTALDILGYERPEKLRTRSAGLVGLVVPELSAGTHVVTATVADGAGTPTAASITLTVVANTLSLGSAADTYVDAGSPTTAFGGSPSLLAGIAPASRQAFMTVLAYGHSEQIT